MVVKNTLSKTSRAIIRDSAMRRKTSNQAWTLHRVKSSSNSLFLSKYVYKAIAFGPSMVKTSANERSTISKLNVFFRLVNCKTLMIVNRFSARIKNENTSRMTITTMWISDVSLGDARSPFSLSDSMLVKRYCNSSFSCFGRKIFFRPSDKTGFMSS